MRKNYEYHDLYEQHIGSYSNTMCYRFSWEVKLYEKTNPTLINNFKKIASWIRTNCPKLNGEFNCRHQVYHWTKLVVENGKAYLETGSHGYGFTYALSETETAQKATGSCQCDPYAFADTLFFPNSDLEEFLSQWETIKVKVIAKNEIQNKVFSEDFIA